MASVTLESRAILNLMPLSSWLQIGSRPRQWAPSKRRSGMFSTSTFFNYVQRAFSRLSNIWRSIIAPIFTSLQVARVNIHQPAAKVATKSTGKVPTEMTIDKPYKKKLDVQSTIARQKQQTAIPHLFPQIAKAEKIGVGMEPVQPSMQVSKNLDLHNPSPPAVWLEEKVHLLLVGEASTVAVVANCKTRRMDIQQPERYVEALWQIYRMHILKSESNKCFGLSFSPRL